ncbi:DUF4145 domain-containing protein [Streptomyces sp. H51]|uniref:DUF4145 domain-containing protein n=1 Tax=Streptomyces sp. H51 TaxID=3111770 RepID=UPI002D7692A2|nr:DUF4145 domain-containing protein [Streptomyces sp. H51]
MTEASDRVGSNILATCSTCDQVVMAVVEGAMIESNPEKDFPTLLQLARCSKCGDGVLVLEEDYGNGWDGDPITVWPNTQRMLSWLIPEPLRRQHEEAHRCFSVKAYTATVVMVRRTLEGVSIDQGVTKRAPLIRMLEELKESGKIDGRLLEWSQALRLLGNEGAHYSDKPVTQDDATDALALAEALMDYLYVYTAQFEKFKQRREGNE